MTNPFDFLLGGGREGSRDSSSRDWPIGYPRMGLIGPIIFILIAACCCCGICCFFVKKFFN